MGVEVARGGHGHRQDASGTQAVSQAAACGWTAPGVRTCAAGIRICIGSRARVGMRGTDSGSRFRGPPRCVGAARARRCHACRRLRRRASHFRSSTRGRLPAAPPFRPPSRPLAAVAVVVVGRAAGGARGRARQGAGGRSALGRSRPPCSSSCRSAATSRCCGSWAAAPAPGLGPRESAHVTLGGTAATRLLPTGGAGGAALTLWALPPRGPRHPRCHAHAARVPGSALRGVPGLHRRGRRAARARAHLRRRPAGAQRRARRRGRAGHRRGAGAGRSEAGGERAARRPPAHRTSLASARSPRRAGRSRRGCAGGAGARAVRRRSPARRARLVGIRRRGALGDAQRARRASLALGRRARLLRRPGGQHGSRSPAP